MKSKTYYQLIMDASGSMSGVQIQTLNALNSQQAEMSNENK
jgi:uncharacterized protein YegL